MTDENETYDRLAADFYDYETLLSEEEHKLLLKARTFMRDEIKPLVNDYWAKGEFPREILGKFRELGLGGLPYEGYGEHQPRTSTLLTGMLAMEMTRIDPSV